MLKIEGKKTCHCLGTITCTSLTQSVPIPTDQGLNLALVFSRLLNLHNLCAKNGEQPLQRNHYFSYPKCSNPPKDRALNQALVSQVEY